MTSSVTIRVFRWDPDAGADPIYPTYEIPVSSETSVVDGLLYVREHIDGSLTLNYSCQRQRCGSCALLIDGKIALGCYTPLKDGQTIAPLPGFAVMKDLVVDWGPYEAKMQELIPAKVDRGALAIGRKISQKDRDLAESAMTCIRCFSCVAACPSVDVKNLAGFAGPAASVMLASYLDIEEQSNEMASSALEAKLEYCTRCGACNTVCPAKIDIVGSIKRLQVAAAEVGSQGKHLKEMLGGYF
jgi:fumarate reductase iron-sulfur subunit